MKRGYLGLLLALACLLWSLSAEGQPLSVYQGCSCTATAGGGGGSGTVTSVDLSLPSWLTVSGNPVTTAGTLAVSAAGGQTSGRVIGTCGAATSFGVCALVDSDIPNNITVDLATVATTANAGDSATAFFPAGTVEAARLPDLSGLNGAVTDAQVPNGITIDLATTCTTANTGDSATAFFSVGTVEANRLPDLSAMNGAVTDAQVPDTITKTGTASKCAHFNASGVLEAATGDCASGDTTGSGIGGTLGTLANAIPTASGTGGSTAHGTSVTLHATDGTFTQTTTNGDITLAPNGTGSVQFPAGTAAKPGMGFTGDADTGFYDRNSDRVTNTLAGTPEYEFQQTAFALNNNNRICWTSGGAVNTQGCGTGIGEVVQGVLRLDRASDGDRGGWQQWAGECFVASDQTNSTTTLQTSTCSISVTSGRKYAFRCELMVAESVAGEGVKVDFGGGTAAATNFRAPAKIYDSTLLASSQLTSLTGTTSAATITGDGSVEVKGSFEPSSTGTFIPRFAQNSHATGTITLYRGSHCFMWDAP